MRMKMVLKYGIVAVIVLVSATTALARGTARVANTVHNLSASGPSWSFYISDEQEICIFCHTPHGGSNTGPLWNRDPAAPSSWQFYDSATISTEVKNVSAISPESMLCLSCHDGSVSVYHLMNYGQNPTITNSLFGTTNETTFITGTPGANPRIGGAPGNENGTGQLGDDHPISFSYDNVYTEHQLAGKSDLNPVGSIPADIRFFGTNNRVECSSCHDPHVDYETDPTYAPFLNMSNAKSDLCLGCHNK